MFPVSNKWYLRWWYAYSLGGGITRNSLFQITCPFFSCCLSVCFGYFLENFTYSQWFWAESSWEAVWGSGTKATMKRTALELCHWLISCVTFATSFRAGWLEQSNCWIRNPGSRSPEFSSGCARGPSRAGKLGKLAQMSNPRDCWGVQDSPPP